MVAAADGVRTGRAGDEGEEHNCSTSEKKAAALGHVRMVRPTMEFVFIDFGMAAACVLSLTFAWAGAAKLGHLGETIRGFADLGLRRPEGLARAVPLVELAVAVALLAAPAVGGVATLVLLSGFTAVLVRALRRGDEVRCACFGQAGGPPLSWVELLRNGLLGVLAGLAVGAGLEPRVPALVPATSVAVVVAASAGLLAVLRHRRRSSRAHGPSSALGG